MTENSIEIIEEVEINTRPPAEVEDLKNQWLEDPCFDLEVTEGFEAHKEELKAFRLKTEARWEEKRKQEHLAKAEALGCPDNEKLGAYVLVLEVALRSLRERVGRLEEED